MNRRARCAALLAGVGLLALIIGPAHAAGEPSMRFLDETAEGEYSVLCPIVIEGEGELRVAFDVVDGASSWVRIADRELTLHHLEGGVAERVGAAASVTASGPTELTVQRRTDRVRVIVGREVALDVPWDAPPGGRVGVTSSGSYVASRPMVQPVEPPLITDDFTRDADEMGIWETNGGSFTNTMVSAPRAEPEMSANPFSLHVSAEDDAVASGGYWFWDSYRVALSVKPVEAPQVELRAWVQDDANHLALRWEAGDEGAPGARRLVLTRDGVEHPLGRAPGGFEPGEWYRLELRVTPGHVEALIDREPVLAAETDALGQGAVGLALAGGDAFFDDLLVAPVDYPDPWPPRINPVFLEDEVMSDEELFLPSSFWSEAGTEGELRHVGEFFDDAVVSVPLQLLEGDGLSVLLRADGEVPAGGYHVDASLTEGRLAITLGRNGAPIASEAAAVTGEEPLRVGVAGDTVQVGQGEREVLRFVDPRPLRGRTVALLDAPDGAAELVTVFSEHFRDYVFGASPTDWFAGRGEWGVTTRWPCEPAWTFFGGTGVENPVVWTKHSYDGDIVVEWFGAIQSDNVNRARYTHPSDINTTICGDGRVLRSGYSFILGGWSNTRTAILRNGEVVAETDEVLLPDPNARNLSAHRGWSRVRMEKLGNRIRVYYEKQLVLEYTDPDPLPGGRVALWSFHNELVAGRVRLWYAREGAPGVVRRPERRVTQLQPTERPAEATEVFNDFEEDSGEWVALESAPHVLLELSSGGADGDGTCLQITNQEDGGPFAVAAVTTPFEVEQWPELSFDYRLTPEVRVNLYLLIDDRWHAVKLTGEQAPWDDVPVIAGVPQVRADGRWHHARVDLLAGLEEIDADLPPATVTQVVLSPPWESYALCGIGGNGWGTRYWIDNFRIGSSR